MSKTALVTGGGRGIGAGIVEKLAAEGWNVVFCGRKEESAFTERCRELETTYGVKAAYFCCDVSVHEERGKLLARILEKFGSLEALVNNAGVAMATKLFAVKMAEFGVPVYEIRPGVISSDMTSVVKAKYDKLIAEGLTLQPRWGEPADIGRAVAMLLRGDLAYSTGQVINVDGGMEIGRL